jgi:hypothetical protein
MKLDSTSNGQLGRVEIVSLLCPPSVTSALKSSALDMGIQRMA